MAKKKAAATHPALNQYNGEIAITLDGKHYPMKITTDTIAKFNADSGHDFMHVAIRAMNAAQAATFEGGLLKVAEMLTKAVPMADAAYLFYHAAKAMDSTVTLDEIQEAVIREGPLKRIQLAEGDEDQKTVSESYPILFVQLVTFAVLGVTDAAKK